MIYANACALGFIGQSEPEVLLPKQVANKDTLTVTFTPEMLKGRRFDKIRIITELTEVVAPADGYMFYPAKIYSGTPLTYFTEGRPDCTCDSIIDGLSFAGIGGCENAIMIQIVKGNANGRFHAEYSDGRYSLSPEFVLNGDEAYETLEVTYRSMPFATYSDMARCYRAYQMEFCGCVPIRDRIAEYPALKYAAESMEFRIRMGWKRVPTPVFTQTPENEPPVQVVCDIAKLRSLTKAMKAAGIDKAQLCLVGWSRGGHDGRFPQNVPSEPAYGTDAEMREFISEAQNMGYQIVCHTGSRTSYQIADNFDIESMSHLRGADGCIAPRITPLYALSGGLSGGVPFTLCAKEAYDKYAVKDLPRVRDYGFYGLHFIDELISEQILPCYHPNHPANRTESEESYRKIAKLSKELFGGFQSECWMDYMNSDVDYIMYTSFKTRHTSKDDKPFNNEDGIKLFDEYVPVWQLVYHGIVLSTPSSDNVNHTMKGASTRLHLLEFGGRPLMYLFSKFGERKNWMGDLDLRLISDDDMDSVIKPLKDAYEEYEQLNYLQYEFMENHEKIGDKVYRVTYSDGTVMTVDYINCRYTVEKDGISRTVEFKKQ